MTERQFKSSVSGRQTSHLIHWCQQQSPSPQVNLVTFHVGVNNTRAGEIAVASWKQVVNCLRRVVSSARVQASSILPAFGNTSLCTTISKCNNNFPQVAEEMGVKYLDNTVVFQAKSSAP